MSRVGVVREFVARFEARIRSMGELAGRMVIARWLGPELIYQKTWYGVT